MKKYLFLILFLALANCINSQNQMAPVEIIEVMDTEESNVPNLNQELYGEKPDASVESVIQEPIAEAASTIGFSKVKGQGVMENFKPFSRVTNHSDPSRYQEIKINPEAASDEIDFWARQMSEHALFLFLGFDNKILKGEALRLHKALENFRRHFNQNPDDINLMDQILPLLKQQRMHQIKALQALDSGQWIGWIFPLFINHVTLELDYFVDKLNGIKYSSKDEVLFWNRINSEHAAFAAHLLDPAERELFVKADKMSLKFNKIPKSEKEMMIRLSIKASKELDKFNKTARAQAKHIKSVIHPVLLDHVIREGERSIKTLTELGLHKESAKFAKQYEGQILDYQYE